MDLSMIGHDHPLPASDTGSFFSNLFEVYVPRQQCMNYEASVIWLHVVSDALIAAAYFTIPVALLYFIRQRRDVAFSWIFIMFAAFILACGTTHIFGVWAIWQPLYKIDGIFKFATALVSVTTAIYLWKMIPMALALPSPQQLRTANLELAREVAERKKAQEAQAVLQSELEGRVAARTRELAERNESLNSEITARREVERQRQELLESERAARGEAERANSHKDEFLATLSHELRTPLSAIQSWAQLLRRDGVTQSEVDQGLAVIERNARLQTQLIEDLLDMSRIISGKLRLDVQVVDMTQVIEAAVASIRPAAEAKRIHLHTVLDPRAGPISGDPSRLQQIVWNLLSNGVKFTPKGGRVQVTLERVNSHVEIKVSDNGVGIDPKFMAHLFERFTQADPTTTRSGGGLGLGLSIVGNLVEQHGGSVTAHSEGPGTGATFLVNLPLLMHAPAAWKRDTRLAPGSERDTRLQLTDVTVLVVDDEPDSRQVIGRMLEVSGATTVSASSAEEALTLLQAQRPTIIVSDIGMPMTDGYAFIRRVRQLSPEAGGNVPAVALTALASSEDRRRALQAGFQMHVVKPVDADELVTVVASLLGRVGIQFDQGRQS